MTRIAITTVLLAFTVFLPLVSGGAPPNVAALCEHPSYNNLAERVGEEVCYDEAYVEQVWTFEPYEYEDEGGNIVIEPRGGALIASVVYVHNHWYGATWVRCFPDACDVNAGEVISLTGTVLGAHTMASRYPEDGIEIPAISRAE